MKSNKNLWRLSVTATLEAEEAVAELLGTILDLPASSHCNVETQVSIVSIFGPQKIILARGAREEIFAGLERIKKCGLKIGSGKITIAKVRREDWAESWKRHFKPIEIGGALLIKPSWIKRPPRKNQSVVVLDPGLSFGTGQHATTSFCLREIVRFSKGKVGAARRPDQAQSFLDIGTGSGILAIAAAKLGYKPVHAFDFDPDSVRVARANARVNGVLNKIKIACGDVTKLSEKPDRLFDLICANLISNLLVAERKKIVARLKPGGILVLSGILKSEFWEVQKRFEDLGLQLISGGSKKEWRSGSFGFRAQKSFEQLRGGAGLILDSRHDKM